VQQTDETTLAIIKPDAFKNKVVGRIIAVIEENDFYIAAMKLLRLTAGDARKFYRIHEGKSFFEGLVEFMSCGPCLPMILQGDNALHRWRDLMGPTDPSNAPDNTVRRRFGSDVRYNAVHGSDSPQSAQTEINFFFAGIDLATLPLSQKESNS
jgi:nucleoside-diphosphate kinase